MSTKHNLEDKGKALHIAVVVRSFMEELGKGTEYLGASIQKSGLFPHLMFLWCMVWGVLGLFISIIWIFR